jgi:LPS export ABC transporter protein LptC
LKGVGSIGLIGTIGVVIASIVLISCDSAKEHTAPAIREQDSVAMMTSYGVNTLISDSGVMRYRIISERWEVNDNLNPPRWIFSRGLFLEQFDKNLHVETYIQSDTAYYYTTSKLWYLFGNVRIKTVDGMIFTSEELYWDQNRHELYSNKFSHLITPERELQGAYFVSDEHMRHYKVTNTKGAFTREDFDNGNTDGNNNVNGNVVDTTPKRQVATPRRR